VGGNGEGGGGGFIGASVRIRRNLCMPRWKGGMKKRREAGGGEATRGFGTARGSASGRILGPIILQEMGQKKTREWSSAGISSCKGVRGDRFQGSNSIESGSGRRRGRMGAECSGRGGVKQYRQKKRGVFKKVPSNNAPINWSPGVQPTQNTKMLLPACSPPYKQAKATQKTRRSNKRD